MLSIKTYCSGAIPTLFWLVTFAFTGLSESVNLSWKPSPSPEAVGYTVYYSFNGGPVIKLDAGNQLSATITELVPGQTYSFYATAYDALGDQSSPSTTVTYHVNSPPSASELSGQTDKNQPIPITLVANDSEGDALTYTIVSAPLHGLLSGTSPNLSYTPTSDYLGLDSFTYKASDGKAESPVVTVSISVVEPTDSMPPITAIISPEEGTTMSTGITVANAVPDTIAPSVEITSPSNGATLSDATTINVQAADEVGVTQLDLLLDDKVIRSVAASSKGFFLITTMIPNGLHTIGARSSDAAGNSATTGIQVSIQNPAGE